MSTTLCLPQKVIMKLETKFMKQKVEVKTFGRSLGTMVKQTKY